MPLKRICQFGSCDKENQLNHNLITVQFVNLNQFYIKSPLKDSYHPTMKKFLQSLKDFIDNLPDKKKYLGIGLMVGIVAPIAVNMMHKSIIKLQKAQKETAKLYVGIELGGTNFNLAIGSPEFDRKGNLIGFRLEKQIDGRTSKVPQETIRDINNFLTKNQPNNLLGFDFVGIASFGPLCLDQSQHNFGSITSTPKLEWRNTQLLKTLKHSIRARDFCIETDVNAAAFAQYKLGHHKCKESLAYVTVGTGVGVGVVTQGKTLHGLTHPEGGHIIVHRSPQEYQGFQGVCPYHKNCLQGMICNKSIAERLHIAPTNLHEVDDEEKVWRVLGYYLAQLALNLTLTLSPEVIIIGGGIMNRKVIYRHTREFFLVLLANYVEHPLFTEQGICDYIKEPKLGATVGVKGAMILNFLND